MRLLLPFVCLVAAASAQPSIEAVGDDLVLSAAGDIRVTARSEAGGYTTMQAILARLAALETELSTLRAAAAAPRSTINLTAVGDTGGVPASITAVVDDNSGVGITIASVQAAVPGGGGDGGDGGDGVAANTGEVFIDADGKVGLGVANPLDRLSVSGNIRATGDIVVGADNTNLLEMVTEVRASLNQLRNTVLGTATHIYRSCDHAHANITANGDVPQSGVYTVQPRGLLHPDTWQVYCDMRDDGGWLKLGVNRTAVNQDPWANAYDYTNSLDVQLLSDGDMEVIAGHVAGNGAFADFRVDCDIDLAMNGDNTENDHRLFYVSVDNLKAGHFSESNMMQMRMGFGQDNTIIANRPANCDCCGSTDPSVLSTCQNPWQDRGSSADPASPYYGGEQTGPTFPDSCTTIMCHSKSRMPLDDPRASACGDEGKPDRGGAGFENVVFTRAEFRPRSYTPGRWQPLQWTRNRYTMTGTQYIIYLK